MTTPPEILRELDSAFPLKQEQIESFKRDGYLRLKDVLSKDLLDYYRHYIEEQVNKADKTPLEDDDAYAAAFVQIINIWRIPDASKPREFVFGKRLARIAAQLLEVDGVRLYHDQALFKSPGSGQTPWHSDQFYFPLDSDKTVTVWVPLIDVPQHMGPMEFAVGSHKHDLGRSVGIGKSSDEAVGKAVEQGGFEVVKGGYNLGDVSFHYGWTFHRANGNSSDKERKVMTVIYMDKDIRMTETANNNQRLDRERYLEGVEVGSVCDGPRNPLIWEKSMDGDDDDK